MSYDEMFVAALAILIGIAAAVVAVGPWEEPYQLGSFSAIVDRFGKPTARGVWVAIAVALLSAGVAISGGVRPSYTKPAHSAQLER